MLEVPGTEAANQGGQVGEGKSDSELDQLKSTQLTDTIQFPTRKIYMLFHLDPSVEMTGGPWYTDNELDTEFIKLLSRACLQFVKDRVRRSHIFLPFYLTIMQSFPRNRQTSDEDGPAVRRFYSISSAPAYPTSQQVQAFLSKSNITETDLTVEHVEMLLNVLVLDGEVERVSR
jgi:DNA-directed RNA polymerase III subunit RPC6